jgi:UDP-galactopyranose mutase
MWDGLWIIQQPISNEIQKEEAVLFVERPTSLFSIIRNPRLWRRLFAWMRGPRTISRNLRVLAPLPLFHLGHRFPWLFRIEFAIQRKWILRWAPRSAGRTRVLWLDHPLFECAIGRMWESVAVYHVGDDVAEFRTSHRPTMTRLEDRALSKASVVFAAADELARARLPKNPRTFAIWNAIDTSVYTAAVPPAEFADIEAIGAPRAAFIGVVDSWVDVELLAATAQALPEVSVVVVGPTAISVDALRSLPNVHLLGVRHRRLVPGILRRVSASLVPFRCNDLTARIVPAKVFEALAAGVVPVCTAFSRNLDVLEQRGLVAVARGPAEYVDLVRRAIANDSAERRAELAEFGMRQTWSERWKQMGDILTRLRP